MGADVLLTDLPETIPVLERNIAANAARFASAGGSARAAVLDWTKVDEAPATELLARPFDYILCADLVFNARSITPMLHALVAAAQRGGDRTAVLLAHKSRDENMVDRPMFERIMERFDGEEIPHERQHPDFRHGRIDVYYMTLLPKA
jgi:hypothetical protein